MVVAAFPIMSVKLNIHEGLNDDDYARIQNLLAEIPDLLQEWDAAADVVLGVNYDANFEGSFKNTGTDLRNVIFDIYQVFDYATANDEMPKAIMEAFNLLDGFNYDDDTAPTTRNYENAVKEVKKAVEAVASMLPKNYRQPRLF